MSTTEPPNENKMQFINAPNSNLSDLEGDLVTNQSTQNNSQGNKAKAFTTINLNPLSNPASISGGNSGQIPYISTLDEPVSVTISRDLKAVGYKLGHVFFPKQSNLLLKEWFETIFICLFSKNKTRGVCFFHIFFSQFNF